MTKKKPAPVVLTGLSNETYTITVTERGLRIELDDRHRLVYTSILTGRGYIRFEVEAVSNRAKDRLSVIEGDAARRVHPDELRVPEGVLVEG